MRRILLFLILVLGACDGAGPGFRGLDKIEREVEGSRFTLRVRGDVVEAIRTSPEMFPRFQPVARRAGIAAQMETGCVAKWVMGDPSMMRIGLSCDGRKAPKMPRVHKTIYCDIIDLYGRNGMLVGNMTCS